MSVCSNLIRTGARSAWSHHLWQASGDRADSENRACLSSNGLSSATAFNVVCPLGLCWPTILEVGWLVQCAVWQWPSSGSRRAKSKEGRAFQPGGVENAYAAGGSNEPPACCHRKNVRGRGSGAPGPAGSPEPAGPGAPEPLPRTLYLAREMAELVLR